MASHAATMAELDPALQLPHRRKMEILFAILLVIFLSALDQTIVGVALPRIVGDLGGTNELYTWAITSYLLTATITGVFYGKLSDIYGRRPMLLFGVSVFLLGSVLCGLSWSMESLIIFRGVQGIGAGAIFPISLAVIGDLFDPRERGRYQGLFGAVFGIASVLGPLLGGWITDSFGWHWIFFVNVPIGLVALYIVYRYLPTVHGESKTRNLDYSGAAVFAVGVVFLLLGLTNKATGDWTDFECRRLPAHRGAADAGVPLHRVAGRGADRPAAAVSESQLRGDHPGHVPQLHRLLRRHHLPASLAPVRPERQPHRIRAPDPAAHGRSHPQLRRRGSARQP